MILSFNPRPCVRGDDPVAHQHRRWRRFNPRPCVRGDYDYCNKYGEQVYVSIHAPV